MTKFFWHIVNTLEDPDFDEEVTDLMAWWNKYAHFHFVLCNLSDFSSSRIFPSGHSGASTTDDNVNERDSLAILKAQKAAKRAALANATNHI